MNSNGLVVLSRIYQRAGGMVNGIDEAEFIGVSALTGFAGASLAGGATTVAANVVFR
jgi:hypothetical protein